MSADMKIKMSAETGNNMNDERKEKVWTYVYRNY